MFPPPDLSASRQAVCEHPKRCRQQTDKPVRTSARTALCPTPASFARHWCPGLSYRRPWLSQVAESGAMPTLPRLSCRRAAGLVSSECVRAYCFPLLFSRVPLSLSGVPRRLAIFATGWGRAIHAACPSPPLPRTSCAASRSLTIKGISSASCSVRPVREAGTHFVSSYAHSTT